MISRKKNKNYLYRKLLLGLLTERPEKKIIRNNFSSSY